MTLRGALLAMTTALVLASGRVHTQTAIRSLHVQGNVWMLHSDVANAAVQIGEDGVLVVDTMTEQLAGPLVAEIRRLAGDKPIRIVVNTHVHSDHTGGNATVSGAGATVIGGNAVAELGQAAANRAQVFAHENVQTRMVHPAPGEPEVPVARWPTDTFTESQHDLYFNGEGIELLHQGQAHTDGDTVVYFRKSDVVVTGDVYANDLLPRVDVQNGGDLNGVIKSLNALLRITIPKEKQEGGTFVIPGHGRLADEADIVEYRDMTTILRDRVSDAVKRGQTLAQIKAAKLARDYEGRYGAPVGAWSTDAFIEAAHKSVSGVQSKPGQPARSTR
jgi:glyoxylase-like metal-dependent hydrolase (beta-lactamase superfamily II)